MTQYSKVFLTLGVIALPAVLLSMPPANAAKQSSASAPDEDRRPWEGSFVSLGEWDLAGPFAGGRTIGDAASEWMVDELVSVAGTPGFARKKARRIVAKLVAANIKNIVDDQAPKELRPKSPVMQALARTLGHMAVQSQITLQAGNNSNTVTGQETLTALGFDHSGKRYQLSLEKLLPAPHVTVTSPWNGTQVGRAELDIEPHIYDIRYGQLVRQVGAVIFSVNEMAALRTKVQTAVNCPSLVDKLLKGKKSLKFSIRLVKYTLSRAKLGASCERVRALVGERALGLFSVDTRAEVGGTVRIETHDNGTVVLHSVAPYGGSLTTTPKALAPRVQVTFAATRPARAVTAVTLPANAADAISLLVYTGYGTADGFFLSGRVVEDKKLKSPDADRSAVGNLVDTVRRLESDELAGVEVMVRVGPHSWVRRTNEDGLWSIDAGGLKPALPLGTHQVAVQLKSDPGVPKGAGELLILEDTAGTAVISDFDDTVVHSDVRNKLRLIAHSLLRNATQQVPVKGAASAYLSAQEAGAKAFFYVSGSPQNFYERINDFLRLRKFPSGPVLLKNFGEDSLFAQHQYKLGQIERLLSRFPKLNFVLIGDSGEQDPEIYAKIRAKHGKRVTAIIIRRVQGDESLKSRFRDMHVLSDFRASSGLIGDWVRP